jgi:hypothetical protein
MLITPMAVIAPGRAERDGIEYANDAIGGGGGGACCGSAGGIGGTGGQADGAAAGEFSGAGLDSSVDDAAVSATGGSGGAGVANGGGGGGGGTDSDMGQPLALHPNRLTQRNKTGQAFATPAPQRSSRSLSRT